MNFVVLFTRMICVSISLFLLSACGLKGPLYMPQDEPSQADPSAVATKNTVNLEVSPAKDQNRQKKETESGNDSGAEQQKSESDQDKKLDD